ncbi:polysaccharide deacetylase family protein [Faecalimicrobium sp. JNUCC 81]
MNYKKVAAIVGVSAVLVSSLGVSNLQKSEKENIKVNNVQSKNIQKPKEEIKYKNTNIEGQKHIYDAKKIGEKLSKWDSSNDGKKVVFLTFDDGASNSVTPKILKTLDENNVKATFFITGKTVENGGEKSRKLIKEEYSKGHAIANHSYSHDYKKLYPNRIVNLESFKEDFKKNDDILKSILGETFSTRVLRLPGGHMSWKGTDKLDVHLNESDRVSIDWNALNADAEGKKKNAQELVEHAKKTSKNKEMVVLLMHDTYGKEETAKALPEIIKYFKDNGYEFKTLG